MPARILEVCDAVKARLEELNPGVAVERVYGPEVPPEGPAERTVYVFPAGYAQAETLTRAEDSTDYQVAVLVVERIGANYTEAAVNELLLFVQDNVYTPLQNARAEYLLDDALIPQAAEVESVVDHDWLPKGLFASKLLLTYRENA